jgi:hypothetical protein
LRRKNSQDPSEQLDEMTRAAMKKQKKRHDECRKEWKKNHKDEDAAQT